MFLSDEYLFFAPTFIKVHPWSITHHSRSQHSKLNCTLTASSAWAFASFPSEATGTQTLFRILTIDTLKYFNYIYEINSCIKKLKVIIISKYQAPNNQIQMPRCKRCNNMMWTTTIHKNTLINQQHHCLAAVLILPSWLSRTIIKLQTTTKCFK